MSEELFMFGVTIGMFAILTGIVFGTRAKRYSSGYTPSESQSSHGGE